VLFHRADAFTVGTVSPGTTYRVFVTDLSNTTVSGGRPVVSHFAL
jgi:hypothetical protein